MHEFSIARSIIHTVQRNLPTGERRAVKSVALRVGDFARVTPESLQACFEMASEGTAAQGATLRIETVPIRCACKKCRSEFEAGRYVTICPNCGDWGVELVSGDELDVVEVELSESP